MKKRIFIAIELAVFFSLMFSAGQAAAEKKYFGEGHPSYKSFGKEICDKDGYIEYKPVFYNEIVRPPLSGFYTDEDLIRPGHYERIKILLEQVKVRSGIEYKVIDNKVFVACTLWKEKNSMLNLTIQADSKYIFTQMREDCKTAPNKWCSSTLKSLLDKIKDY